jgi:small subunit ribosomal protein S16
LAVRIRLKKFGAKKRPYYRVVVVDSRAPRNGKTLEEVGLYHPIEPAEKQVLLNVERIQYWISKGAQLSDTMKRLFNKRKK